MLHNYAHMFGYMLPERKRFEDIIKFLSKKPAHLQYSLIMDLFSTDPDPDPDLILLLSEAYPLNNLQEF